jgi:hypothetical protein
MGVRFRRSLKLAPGIRLNLSGSGASLRVGPRGASVSFGRRGTYLNTGIPGTGLYARERLDSPHSVRHNAVAAPRQTVMLSPHVTVKDDGEVEFRDANGNSLSPILVRKLKQQQGPAIHGLIEDCCNKVDAPVNALGEIHLHTPDPRVKPNHTPQPFPEPEPQPPTPKTRGFWGWLFPPRARRIERENDERAKLYVQQHEYWLERKAIFEAGEARRKQFVEDEILHNTDAMERFLEENLLAIEWPRETHISFAVLDQGHKVALDVELPAMSEMPTKTAAVPAQGYRLNVREMPASKVQQLYMRHVHGISFRLIGEVFADLPTVQTVVLSAFTERPDPGTAALHNDYVYSVRVARADWERIDFANLGAIDVVEALGRFELRRELTRAGALHTVEPFSG